MGSFCIYEIESWVFFFFFCLLLGDFWLLMHRQKIIISNLFFFFLLQHLFDLFVLYLHSCNVNTAVLSETF